MVGMPPPYQPADMPPPFAPAPYPRPGKADPCDWTVSLTVNGTSSRQTVRDALPPKVKRGVLVFTDAAGSVIASFPEDQVDSYDVLG